MAVNSTALRYFVKVAELGSFRSASEALHIAASAVNRQIVQMEEELGAQLFERHKGRKNLRLTAAGETLLVHARSVLYEIKRAHEQIDALKGLRAGSVVVGVPETFARDFMPRVLAEFHERLPGITFNVVVDTSQRLIELLARDEIEVAMCYDPPRHQDLVYVAEIERAVHAMMPADHPLAKRERLRLSDCADYPMVMPSQKIQLRTVYEQAFGRAGVKPRIVLETSSYEMMRSMARAGLGVALTSKYISPADDMD